MEAVIAKVITIIVLLAITLILGIIPYFIIRRGGDAYASRRRERVLSIVNCFAGGVFLGTCLLHLFLERKEDLEDVLDRSHNFTGYPAFEVIVGGGFFLIAFLEQVALMCMAGVAVTSFSTEKQKTICYKENGYRGESTPLLKDKTGYLSGGRVGNGVPCGMDEHDDDDNYDEAGSQSRSQSRASELERSISHTHEFETISNASGMRACLLLIALFFHTIFDGLAVGLRVTDNDIWEVFVAISIHTSLVAFCLGLQLFRAFQPYFKKPFACLLLFSIMSSIGISIGIAVKYNMGLTLLFKKSSFAHDPGPVS